MVVMPLLLSTVKPDMVRQFISLHHFLFCFILGKIFTMGGDLSVAKTDYSHGIYAQTARDIFHCLSLPQYCSTIEIFVTFYEIYFGKIFDLLNNKKTFTCIRRSTKSCSSM
jgi:hypothetical protein